MLLLLIISIFLVITVILMRKNISQIELYISYLFMVILTMSINVVIDAKYNLRGFFEKGADYPTMMVNMIIIPFIFLIFLNFYPNRKQSIVKKIIYILSYVLALIILDVILLKFNILYYKHWIYIYSILLFTIEFLCILLNRKIVSYLKQVSE